MNKGLIAAVFSILALLAIVGGVIGSGLLVQQAPIQPTSNELGAKWDGYVHVVAWRPSTGEILLDETKHNILTDEGQDWLELKIAKCDGSATCHAGNMTYISLTNNSTWVPAVTNVYAGAGVGFDEDLPEIDGRGLGVSVATYAAGMAAGAGNWLIYKQFTATNAVNVVRGAALVNGTNVSTNPVMLAGAVFTSVNLLTGDKINVTWNVSVS